MKTYVVVNGDTFERISTVVYGTSDNADLIRSANAPASGGLVPGMVLVMPPQPIDDPGDLPVAAGNEDEVTITLAGKVFVFWLGATFRFAMDEFSSFSFTSPFDPDDPVIRKTFVPLSFQDIKIYIGGSLELTGTIAGLEVGLSVGGRVLTVQGYARAGVLEDSTLPANVARENDGATLAEVTTLMCRPFGLTPVFSPKYSGPPILRVAIEDSQKLSGFFVKLAQQRGFLLSSDKKGHPFFQKEIAAGKPVQVLTEGLAPLQGVSPRINARTYYSYISSVTPTYFGFGGAIQTLDNPFLNDSVRPLTFKANDTNEADNLDACRSKMGRMFADAISFTIDLAGWRDGKGNLWRPNTTVRLFAPGAMVYKETEFLIRSVDLSRAKSKSTTRLNVVLPGSFAGKIPETLPWLE